MPTTVQVALRVRPILQEEQKAERFGCIRVDRERSRVSLRTNNKDETYHADFDRVFDEKSSQERVFEKVIAPLVSDFVAGRNCCVLVYGEKESGKTYTMMGPSSIFIDERKNYDGGDDDDDRSGVSSMGSGGVSRQQIMDQGASSGQLLFEPPQQILAGTSHYHPDSFRSLKSAGDNNHRRYIREINAESGMIPRTAREIFSLIRKRRKRGSSEKDDPKVRLSFVEVYHEKIIDLLNRKHAMEEEADGEDGDDTGGGVGTAKTSSSLLVRSNPDEGVFIEGATVVPCRSEDDVLNALDKATIIRQGRASRLGKENLSRSHAVVILKIERYSRSRGKSTVSNFFLVDLADSTLVKRPQEGLSDAEHREYMAVHKATRKSLGALRKCIRLLAEGGKRPLPWAESTLTKLLHSALSRSAGVNTIINVSPMSTHAQESLSSIRFGSYIAARKDTESSSSADAAASRTSKKEERGRAPDRSRSSSRFSSETTRRESFMDRSKSENQRQKSQRGRPTDRSKSSTRKLEKGLSRRSSTNKSRSRGKSRSKEDSFILSDKPSSITAGSRRSIKQSSGELETAGKVLESLPDNPKATPETDPIKELSHVSDLLESAAKRMEAELIDARDELKNSGFEESMSAAEIQKQLLEVTKELESMKFESQLASQIENDLTEVQVDSKQISPLSQTQSNSRNNMGNAKIPTDQTKQEEKVAEEEEERVIGQNTVFKGEAKGADKDEDDPAVPSPEITEVERLRKEIEDLAKKNGSLSHTQQERLKEIECTKQETKATKIEIEQIEQRKSEQVLFDECGEKSTQKTSQTSTGTDTDGSAVNNLISPHYFLRVMEESDIEDTWGEQSQEIQLGPCPISVCLRLRPLLQHEVGRRGKPCIQVHEGNRDITVDAKYDFTFDEVFDMDCSQEEVYETIGISVVDHLVAGINCAVLVYGPPGSGKTFTLSGREIHLGGDRSAHSSSESSETDHTQDDASGFAPRLISDLFHTMRDSPNSIEHRISCYYICICQESAFDLLDPKFDNNLVLSDNTNGINIEGATEAFCFNEDDVFDLIRRGAACRRLITKKTKSSRSHSVIMLKIEQRHVKTGNVRRSYLQMAELSGFDLPKGKGQHSHEAREIQKSFSVFGSVIKSLVDGKNYAPYRESKITSILKDSFGGNCKSTLIVTASSSSTAVPDTLAALRLGEQVGQIMNYLKVNIDANLEDYRKWFLHSELKLAELSTFAKKLSNIMNEASTEFVKVREKFSSATWESLLEIAEREDASCNAARNQVLSAEAEDFSIEKPRWKALYDEVQIRQSSDEIEEIERARNRAQHLLKDIQSESVVLRRQNDLLVKEKRKKEDDLGAAHRENRKSTLRHSEIEHNLALAENRAKEAITFLKYMRMLCWKLHHDAEEERTIDVSEITNALHEFSDLSGLVDLDAMMLEAGFLHVKGIAVRHPDSEYFDYLQEAGLTISEEQEGEEDADGGGDEKDKSSSKPSGSNIYDYGSIPDDASKGTATTDTASYIGSMFGWSTPAPYKASQHGRHSDEGCLSYGQRNTRREQELHKDLQDMANRCVELQMELNDKQNQIEDLIMKATSVKMNTLAKESLAVSRERDRMMNNAKAATWKLQELHVVNRLLSKQSKEHKQQVKFLEDGFQRLQESVRGAIQDGFDADQHLRERVKTLNGIVNSLAGPLGDDNGTALTSEDSHPLKAHVHLPVRGEREK